MEGLPCIGGAPVEAAAPAAPGCHGGMAPVPALVVVVESGGGGRDAGSVEGGLSGEGAPVPQVGGGGRAEAGEGPQPAWQNERWGR